MVKTKVIAVHPNKFPGRSKTIMLQIKGNTYQCITPNKTWFDSDTFNRQYDTLTEAKDHTREKYDEGYWNK